MNWCSCTHTHCAEAALLGPASTNKQSVSQGKQRGLRGSPANLSLTSLETKREANWIYIFVFNPPYTLYWSYSILWAGIMYSQGEKQITTKKKRGFRVRKNILFSYISQRKRSSVSLSCVSLSEIKMCHNIWLPFGLHSCMTLVIQTEMSLPYRPPVFGLTFSSA